jgi:hypothetical protein
MMRTKSITRRHVGFLAGGLLVLAGAATASIQMAPHVSFIRDGNPLAVGADGVQFKPLVKHVPTPVPVRAIYMSQCVVGTPSFRDELVKLVDETELNAVVIDIRDYTGKIAFPIDEPDLKDYVSDECGADDMQEFVERLHDKGIYVIGRITVFQNPAYTKAHPEEAVQHVEGGVWKDHKGLAFVDVGARPYWDHVVKLSTLSYELGFDELNFDYIRFPSDGDMKAAVYSWSDGKSKADALEEFFAYLHNKLAPTGAVLSADLFGYVTVHLDDLGIGQLLERALPYFDYVAPMVYPSHYNRGFAGLSNVNSDPYKVVYTSMVEAVKRTLATTTPTESFAFERIGTSTPAVYAKPSYPASKMRPWLQSFDYPVPYTPEMVRAQIQANTDAGLDSWMFWDSANRYRSLQVVLRSE